MDFSKIKNIIFDLGAVIINIDPEITYAGFASKSGKSTGEIKKLLHDSEEIWNRHETGDLSDSGLRQKVREILNLEISDAEFDQIWNDLLLDIPVERIELIQKLSEKYKVFLLSNTNGIHVERFNRILEETTGIADFAHIFEKAYYSHEMGMRKPDVNIYYKVLENSGLKAEETLFLDDNFDNITAASSTGIHVLHVKPPLSIIELLKNA